MKNIGGSQNDIRIEIAILQEDVSTNDNKNAEFKIPTVMGEDNLGAVTISNKNIKNSLVQTSRTVYEKNTISLPIPYYFKIFFGSNIIPKGTTFLVELSYDNIMDARIIGIYDKEVIEQYQWNYIQLERKVQTLINSVKLLQKFAGIDQDWSD